MPIIKTRIDAYLREHHGVTEETPAELATLVRETGGIVAVMVMSVHVAEENFNSTKWEFAGIYGAALARFGPSYGDSPEDHAMGGGSVTYAQTISESHDYVHRKRWAHIPGPARQERDGMSRK